MDEREREENIVLYQLLKNTVEDMEKQMVAVEQKMVELKATQLAIEEIKKIRAENEILVPMGTGIYGHGKITDKETLLVDVGANILMEKNPEAAEKFINERMNEIKDIERKIKNDMGQLANKMNEIAFKVNRTPPKR
ncbi:MAG: prefoldin subunit alpha [Candidatus Micrarchaeota archaeon]|nr:prefoldin subunit alpha [Candidatus Micrarchaeota archaeon]